jgi:predicted ArsR family transcriptional regulator
MTKSKQPDDKDTILTYLTRTNRPYSAGDVALNLKLGKAQVQKALASLVKDQVVTAKAYGKTSIYFSTQVPQEKEETGEEEKRVQQLKVQVQDLTERVRDKQQQLKACETSLSDEALAVWVQTLRKQNSEYQDRLATIQGNMGGVVITDKERKAIDTLYIQMEREYKQRKRLVFPLSSLTGVVYRHVQHTGGQHRQETPRPNGGNGH